MTFCRRKKPILSYKLTHPFEKRKQESHRLRIRYPSRCPVIIQDYKEALSIPKLKYLVPLDISMNQFLYMIRRRTKLKPEEALYCYLIIEIGTIPQLAPLQKTIGEVYVENQDKDGMLYLIFCKEDTFGSS